MSEKLKSFLMNDHIFFGLVIILVGVGSFGLGRASVGEGTVNLPAKEVLDKKPQVLQAATSIEAVEPTLSPTSQSKAPEEIVASKSGTKYHLVGCGGAKQIKPENKIFFTSRIEAEAAGYKPAANCPGLQ